MERLSKGAQAFRIALLCVERDPVNCHRALLVGRELERLGACVLHIHQDGGLEAHGEAPRRLARTLRLSDAERNGADLINVACAKQEERVAYRADQEHPVR